MWEPIVCICNRWWYVRQRWDGCWEMRPSYPGVTYQTRADAMRDAYAFARP